MHWCAVYIYVLQVKSTPTGVKAVERGVGITAHAKSYSEMVKMLAICVALSMSMARKKCLG
jgi:hypothetical protein